MAWITPKEQGAPYDGNLPDDDPITVELVAVETLASDKFPENGPRLQMKWRTVEDKYAGAELMSWTSLHSLGATKSGTPSMMRQLINAVAGRAFDAEVKGLDDETLEFSTTGDSLDGKIAPGVRVIVRGNNITKPDAQGDPRKYFKIEKYRAMAPAVGKPNGAAKPAGKPASAAKPVAVGADYASNEPGF